MGCYDGQGSSGQPLYSSLPEFPLLISSYLWLQEAGLEVRQYKISHECTLSLHTLITVVTDAQFANTFLCGTVGGFLGDVTLWTFSHLRDKMMLSPVGRLPVRLLSFCFQCFIFCAPK